MKSLSDDQNLTLVDSPSKMLHGAHFAILCFEKQSIFHKGDERSKTHPGHGYPAWTEKRVDIKYYATADESHWKTAIENFMREKNNLRPGTYSDEEIVAIKVEGKATIQTAIMVNVG